MQCEKHIGKREGEKEGGYVGGGREQLWGKGVHHKLTLRPHIQTQTDFQEQDGSN